MDVDILATHLRRPEVLQSVLKGYSGAYSLGVTSDPDDATIPAILIRVSGEDTSALPKSITLDHQKIKVVSLAHFSAPQAG